MKRRVIEWKDVTPATQWIPILECGHEVPHYDDGDTYSDEAKAAAGDAIECSECRRLEKEAEELEERLGDIRARLRSPIRKR